MAAPLDWQTIEIPFGTGLSQKWDPRSRQTPALDICRDAQFDALGGLVTRYPYAAMSNAIQGGGTLTNCRRIVAHGDELLVFTDTALYSWNAAISKWVLRDTHMAVSVTETPRFVTVDDQINADRAELSGLIVYVWEVSAQVFAAVMDKATGAVLVTPFSVSTTATRPRIIALQTKILITYFNTSTTRHFCRSFDPVAVSFSSNTQVGGGIGNTAINFDVQPIVGADSAVIALRTASNNYAMAKALVSGANAITFPTGVTETRACTGDIAIAIDPAGVNVQVIRATGSASPGFQLVGDLLTVSVFADVQINSLMTAALVSTNLTACYSTTPGGGGSPKCVFFYSQGNLIDSVVGSIDQNNVIVTSTLIANSVPSSRAFEFGGHVYCWLTFAHPSTTSSPVVGRGVDVQNVSMLYRDDSIAVGAKALDGVAAENGGSLPTVSLTATGEYTVAATQRRLIDLGTGTGYAARSPRDVAIKFDTVAARRTARIGRTLYIAAGEVAQYDGDRIAECGFSVFPWTFTPTNGSPAGSVANGTYGYKMTYRSDNANGERERSTTATFLTFTSAGANSSVAFGTVSALDTTRKRGVAIETWRTTASPTIDSPTFLVTSQDPSVVNGSLVLNAYLPNNPSSQFILGINDGLADTVISAREANPENGNVLESISPPGAKIIASTDTRIFLAGMADDPDVVWYSRLRDVDEIASFNDSLTFRVPHVGGDITALAFLNDTLVVFRETAIYAFGGDGFDNDLGGQNYGPSRIISSDVGAQHADAVVLTPLGLMFKSSKGWYLVATNWDVRYFGDSVSGFDSDAVLSVDILESQHQVRILTPARMVVFDYFANQWGEWTIADGVHSTMWNGTHVYLTATGPKLQQTTYAGLTYGMDIETCWIKAAALFANATNTRSPGLQGSGRIRYVQPIGEYRSPHHLRIRVARDYLTTGVGGDAMNALYMDDVFWPPAMTVIGGPEQVRHGPSVVDVQAIKVRLTAVDAANHANPPSGEALRLSGLTVELTARKTAYKLSPAQKA